MTSEPLDIPTTCLPPSEPDLVHILESVAKLWGFTLEDLRSSERTRRVSAARRAAVQAAFALRPSSTTTELGIELCRDHSTIVHLRKR